MDERLLGQRTGDGAAGRAGVDRRGASFWQKNRLPFQKQKKPRGIQNGYHH